MLITLFTDCSFSYRLSRGTWAAWFKVDGKTYRYSGTLREQIAQSAEGELRALANGLHYIKKTLAAPSGTKIIAQMDSVEAINAIRSKAHPRPQAKETVDYILAILTAEHWRLVLRHVKGHQGNATPRSAVNSWCDRECRRLMGELLAATNTPDQLSLPGI